MPGHGTIAYDNKKLLVGFIGCWIGINFLQALFTGVYPDEAYYWVFSQNLAWGYFDHPPMVALFVKLGELLGHGSLYTRFGTILLSAGGVFFLFKALPEEIADTRNYIIGFLSVIIFHVYSFVATPDGALFFFTALFFYAYRLYLKKESLLHSFFIAISIAGLLYSKYHGVLPVVFTFLSNPKLIFKRTAWLVVVLVIVFAVPHISWQYANDWPTIRYHLLERVASRYKISKTTDYIFSQFMVWGPLTAWLAFYHFIKMGKQDAYIRAHQVNFWGVLLFFLLSSFKSSIEPHWTLVAGPSFIVLLQLLLHKAAPAFKKVFTRLALINLAVAVFARVLVIIPGSPIADIDNLRPIIYGKVWADSIKKYAGNTAVVFTDSYSLPALYKYYNPQVATTSFNTINYRKNYYTMSDDEAQLNNKKVFLYTGKKIDSSDIFVANPYANAYLHLIDSFKAVNVLKIEWPLYIKEGKAGEQIKTSVRLVNQRPYAIEAGDKLYFSYTFFKTRKEQQTSPKALIKEETILPGDRKNLNVLLKLPQQAGRYRLVYSIVSPPFKGTLASHFFTIKVK